MRTGIILVNTGTPDSPTPDAVERYLAQFLTNDRIRPMPKPIWRWLLKHHILPRHKNSSAEKYLQIWTDEGSPLETIQNTLAGKLEESLRREGFDVRAASAMSFGASSLKAVVSALRSGFDPAGGDHLVMSFHSVPLADVKSGDTYPDSVRATADEIAKRLDLAPGQHTVCYQCRFDKGRAWLSPFLGPELEKLANDPRIQRVFVMCPNFSIDCLETLYDIQTVARKTFLAHRREAFGLDADPELSFVYVACLNDTDDHIRACSHILTPYLKRER